MKRMDKFVRDRIPEKIQAEGRPCEVNVLEGEDFDHALQAQLVEEVPEVAGANTRQARLVKRADVPEGVESLMSWHSTGDATVRAVQSTRRSERGGFERQLWVGGGV